MLSHDLGILENWFREIFENRSEFTQAGAVRFLSMLEACKSDAKEMEELEFLPNGGQLEERHLLDSNVVQLPIVPRSIPSNIKSDGSVL